MQNINDNSALVAHLIMEVKNFENSLDSEHKASLRFISSNGIPIEANSVAYRHPDLICFYGLDANGDRAAIFQHITQTNFLLVARKVVSPGSKRTIGFHLDNTSGS
ncbi:DUF6173 family protein [Enterocloster lavalensis]|uniref:DUF6173 family protein n=1 Tax=Enterocloster lavalensis TaxID=460384 RepID=UPI002FDB50E9